MNTLLKQIDHRVEVCVVGGGMAGLVAAVASARRGAKTLLIHDRPVLGGNASSEVRMWICGAKGKQVKETGILEEIQLANLARNPEGLYSVWDSVLFEFAMMTPGLTTLLNTTVNDAEMGEGALRSVTAWQLSTQTWHRVEASVFIDCSGDSILAPLSGADTRRGRESREEFGESIAPLRSDLKTMGSTLLLQIEDTGRPTRFVPPRWAYVFDDSSTLPSRVGNGFGANFWWLELGGLNNTIDDAENIRNELVRTAWGVWDYMKNRGAQAEKLRNWRLRWMGSVPGKRESRRYLGPHVLSQTEIEAAGPFEDVVAYGGWSMDDHHPAGLYYPGRATLFHPAPSPYGIPFRSLYSRNVPNLLFAGRNISATHVAMSSTRVMGTCSVIGQAAGTAAALCVRESCRPADISGARLRRLQQHLMEDDCWLPGFTRPLSRLMSDARIAVSNAGDAAVLLNGRERSRGDVPDDWRGGPGDAVTLQWDTARQVHAVRIVFDSDLDANKRMPCHYPLAGHDFRPADFLVKAFSIEVRTGNGSEWTALHRITDNARRMVVLPVDREVKGIRLRLLEAWGDTEGRVFSIEAFDEAIPLTLDPPAGRKWTDVMADIAAADLAPPDNGLEGKAPGHRKQ